MSKEQEEGIEQDFDILIFDAFNSDAIPIHLLTHKAFILYADSLAEDGLIAVHVSNRFFNLMHIVARQGMEVGLESLRIRSNGAPRKYESLPSKWVLLSRNGDRIAKLAQALPQAYEDMGLKAARMAVIHSKREALMHIRLWTDNFSNLLNQLKPL